MTRTAVSRGIKDGLCGEVFEQRSEGSKAHVTGVCERREFQGEGMAKAKAL